VSRRWIRPAKAAIVASACMLLAGCLSGGYDTDLGKSLDRYRLDGQFQRLRPEPHRLADDRFVLRVPKLFESENADASKGRATPPFLKDLPGFRIAFEAMIEAEGAKLPAVLSIGVLTDKDAVLEEVKKRILEQVRKEPAFAKEAWTVDAQPAGVATAWAVLRLRGPQPFDRETGGIAERKNTDGETQIWTAADPDKKVVAVLVWRVPQELVAAVPLEELTALVMRTVEFKEMVAPVDNAAADAAKPAAPVQAQPAPPAPGVKDADDAP
jgi:hypothetical protein